MRFSLKSALVIGIAAALVLVALPTLAAGDNDRGSRGSSVFDRDLNDRAANDDQATASNDRGSRARRGAAVDTREWCPDWGWWCTESDGSVMDDEDEDGDDESSDKDVSPSGF